MKVCEIVASVIELHKVRVYTILCPPLCMQVSHRSVKFL